MQTQPKMEIHNWGIFLYVQDMTVTTTKKHMSVLMCPEQEIFTPAMWLCRGKRATEVSADILHCCIQSLELQEPEKSLSERAFTHELLVPIVSIFFYAASVLQICFCTEWYLYAKIMPHRSCSGIQEFMRHAIISILETDETKSFISQFVLNHFLTFFWQNWDQIFIHLPEWKC